MSSYFYLLSQAMPTKVFYFSFLIDCFICKRSQLKVCCTIGHAVDGFTKASCLWCQVCFAEDMNSSITVEDCQGNLSPSSSSSSSSSLSSASSPNQQPLSIGEELWMMAEERAQEILYIIQPNVVSELTRKEVTDYLQSLIRGYYGAEV